MPASPKRLSSLASLLLLALVACRPSPPSAIDLPASPPTSTPAPEPAPPPLFSAAPSSSAPLLIERIRVPNDLDVHVVRGDPASPPRTVFLAGICSNAAVYLYQLLGAAHAHGGVLTLEGDQACRGAAAGFHTYTQRPELQRARIEAALRAAGAAGPPADGLTIVGYSLGAIVAERLHARWPALFPRVVLIAPPWDPPVAKLRTARGVVAISCSLDVPVRMESAARSLRAAGVPALYLEMPGCRHGAVVDGERVFDAAFAFLERADGR